VRRSRSTRIERLKALIGKRRGWLSWLVGLATLGTVIAVVTHGREVGPIWAVLRRAKLPWLLAGIVLQAATYLAQGESWRLVTRKADVALSWRDAFELSLAKLFVDQALPSSGVSGTVVAVGGLEARGVPRPIAIASMVASGIGYHSAYLVALYVAVAIALVMGEVGVWVLLPAAALTAYSTGMIAVLVHHTGRRKRSWIGRVPLLRRAAEALADGDRELSRDRRVVAYAFGLQLIVIAIDAATLWLMAVAVGARPSVVMVFVAFMLSSLLRTVSVVPGGLGAFEGMSTWMLARAGMATGTALAATLAFRALDFWLPMIPGLLLSRSAAKRKRTRKRKRKRKRKSTTRRTSRSSHSQRVGSG
jgi:Mg2+-importing ATPase